MAVVLYFSGPSELLIDYDSLGARQSLATQEIMKMQHIKK
jgi:hypothetical protein